MSEIFSDYAEYYDLLYEDKPYQAEAEFIAALITRFSGSAVSAQRVIDLACGTGRHCFELVAMGYDVDGSDISAAMIARAVKAAGEKDLPLTFHNHSFQEAHLIGKKYDVALTLFSALCYLTTHHEIMVSLKNIHTLLEPQGLFIFDYWNGNAVVKEYSPLKILQKAGTGRELIRISRTNLDITAQVAHVGFQFICLENGVKQHEFTEQHDVRYFFFKEIETYLDICGFDLLYRSRFMGESYTPDDWNITIVARKR
jgi:SAM-dependent methyltransferase